MIKVNDIVRFLNDVGGGRVARIEGNIVYVEDEDGFERPALTREVVVVGNGGGMAPGLYEKKVEVKSKLVEPDKPQEPHQLPKPAEPVIETPEGEVLNLYLAFEPREIKHLNTTTFYVNFVNDSNYFVYISFMTRGDTDATWTTRYHGLVEPNLAIELEEVGHADLGNEMTHLAVQYMAFKQGKEFKLKNPALVHHRLDFTKFYKVHCFSDSDFFDTPVITFNVARNDLPVKEVPINAVALEKAMNSKKRVDERHQTQSPKPQQPKKRDEIIVQDLHIGELLDTISGMSNSDILNYQLDKFNEVMRANLKNQGQRIVFIHGKGEGVLRRAIMDELRRHYPQCDVQDASFQEYGFGATQVTIHRKN